MNFTKYIALSVLLSFLPAGILFCQVVPQKGDLREREKVKSMQLSFRPPCFWLRLRTEGTSRISFAGPLTGGIQPLIILVCAEGNAPVDEQVALYRGRTRALLLEKGVQDIKLLQEVTRSINGRTVLVELYEFREKQIKASAKVFHFTGGRKNYTFVYIHASERFDEAVELADKVFASIELFEEQAGMLDGFIPWISGLLLLGGTAFFFVSRAREKMIEAEGVADLKDIEAAEWAKRGPGGLVFGDDAPELDAPVDAETGFKILDLSKRKK